MGWLGRQLPDSLPLALAPWKTPFPPFKMQSIWVGNRGGRLWLPPQRWGNNTLLSVLGLMIRDEAARQTPLWPIYELDIPSSPTDTLWPETLCLIVKTVGPPVCEALACWTPQRGGAVSVLPLPVPKSRWCFPPLSWIWSATLYGGGWTPSKDLSYKF